MKWRWETKASQRHLGTKAGSREEEKPRPVDSYCIGAIDAFVRSYVGRVKGWFKRKMTHDKTVHWHFAANSSPVDKPFLL